MFCSRCGAYMEDTAHFCNECGTPRQPPVGLSYSPPEPLPVPEKPARRSAKQQDPYQQQIKQLKLEIRQIKLNLKQVNTEMSTIRSQYNQSSAFVPRGILKHGYKEIEDARLWGHQKKKQELQQEIIQLEQQLLSLQQQQEQWKAQQA